MTLPGTDATQREWTRRELLRAGAAGALLATMPGCAGPAGNTASSRTQTHHSRVFRFVHLTDIHVQRELNGDKGFAKALTAVEALRPRPEFILTGGDLVFDAFEVTPQRAKELFTLYKKIVADNTSLTVHPCLGNHDIFGWKSPGVDSRSPGYGKAMAMDYLGMSDSCYHFDYHGWRFFVLDNIQSAANEDGYRGGLSPQQTEWLADALRQTPAAQPIVVCEHIPLITVTAFAHEGMMTDGAWRFRDNFVCGDATARLKLLRERNVRLSLSGHIHERDRIEYCGTTFINDGAVCGAWWKGPNRGVEEGFGVIDVRDDGSFDHQYFDYGWQAVAES
jgi:Icc protein